MRRRVPGGLADRPYNPQVARDTGTKLIAENRRSRHDYELLERVEAGIVLTGTEVKALRAGHVQLGQAFADIRGGEMWLIGASISEYAQGNISNHVTDRDRKLLLKRSEIDSLLREGAREGAHARADQALLQGRQGQARGGARPRQGQGRQAALDRRPRRQAADGAGAQGQALAQSGPDNASRRTTRPGSSL